jgi:hypothetical protein
MERRDFIMNKEFKRMKAGSEKINQMMKDIRWCVATMQGIVNSACKDFPIFLEEQTKISMGVHLGDGDEYFVEIRLKNGKIPITILAEDLIRDPSKQWNADEIKFVYDNLDVVIKAVRLYCATVSRAVQFRNLMTELTYVIDH